MKVFLDTNIFLDLLFARKNMESAKAILNLIEGDVIKAVIADITLINIDYIAKKQKINLKTFLDSINQVIKVVGADNSDIATALKIEHKDFEDCVQIALAKKEACQMVITNDKSFPITQMVSISSSAFVEQFI